MFSVLKPTNGCPVTENQVTVIRFLICLLLSNTKFTINTFNHQYLNITYQFM